jgi:hypothetical protein
MELNPKNGQCSRLAQRQLQLSTKIKTIEWKIQKAKQDKQWEPKTGEKAGAAIKPGTRQGWTMHSSLIVRTWGAGERLRFSQISFCSRCLKYAIIKRC